MRWKIFACVFFLSVTVSFFPSVLVFAQEYPDGSILRAKDDVKLYVIHHGQKRWLKNVRVFDSYHFEWRNINVTSQEALDAIPSNNLVHLKDDAKVYFLNAAGFRRHIQNPETFNSYGFDWNDIADISEEELASYQESYLVKSSSKPEIYFLEGKVKRWVTDIEAFYKNEFEWEAVSVINAKDLESYQSGEHITPKVKVQRAIPAIPAIPPSTQVQPITSPVQPVSPPTATSTPPLVMPSPVVPPVATSTHDILPTPPLATPDGGGSGSSSAPAQPATPAVPAQPPAPTSLTISNVSATQIDSSGATITWTTNKPSYSLMFIGPTSPTNQVSDNNNSFATSHSYWLHDSRNFQPNTLYYYKVGASEIKSVYASAYLFSDTYTFTTNTTAPPPPPDIFAPLISSAVGTGTGPNSAQISWATDEDSTSMVEYGLTTSYGSSASDSNLIRAHVLALSNLQPNTLYHFKVWSKDIAGNQGFSGDLTFTTLPLPDLTPPTIYLTVPVPAIGVDTTVFGTAVTVSADASDNIGVVGVQFKIDGANLGAEDANAPYSLSWDTTKVVDGYYKISAVARDQAGNITASAWTMVRVYNASPAVTPGDTTPPTISNITVSGVTSSQAIIDWGTNEAADSRVMYGTTSLYGSISTFDVSLSAPLGHSVVLSNLKPNTLYHFQVSSKDSFDNIAVSQDKTFTTLPAPNTTISLRKPLGFLANAWWAIRDLFKK